MSRKNFQLQKIILGNKIVTEKGLKPTISMLKDLSFLTNLL